MKKAISLLMTVFILFSIAGCKDNKSNKTEIIVFAASSLTETLTDIKDLYETKNPDIKITYNFDSSGILKTQIEEGAYCDIFISANEKSIDELNDVALYYNVDLLENQVGLAVTDAVANKIYCFDDMVKALINGEIFMAIGNEDVPVGSYTKKIFEFYDIDEELLNKKHVLTYCSNAKEVATLVSEEIVDCAIVYMTDAYVNKLNVVDVASEDMCGRVIYPAAVLNNSQNISQSEAFLYFLKSAQAEKIFKNVGFVVIK